MLTVHGLPALLRLQYNAQSTFYHTLHSIFYQSKYVFILCSVNINKRVVGGSKVQKKGHRTNELRRHSEVIISASICQSSSYMPDSDIACA